jgi:predicted small lipoprotein YifL
VLSRLLRAATALVLAAALAAALASCGKKGDVRPPPGEESDYPRTYPSE